MSPTADGPLKAIAALLAERIGLDAATLGESALAAAIRARHREAAGYVDRLRADELELRALTEELVVLESWFFRDVQPFECLRWFAEERCRARPRPLQLLSAPCGTGEEPFSMALTLLAAGLGPDELLIDACDLSRRALARAAEGVYGPRSFRESVLWAVPWCQRHLQAEGEKVRVGEGLRARVQFHRGNLVDPAFLAGQRAAYDVIFCRNLLIYFTDGARETALAHLHRLLRPGGLLYLGHTERRAALDPRFAPLDPRYPFALTPAGSEARGPTIEERGATRPRPALFGPSRTASPAPQPSALGPPASTFGTKLEEARAAADGGRLDEAGRLCEVLVRLRPPSADAVCLLGVVRQAQGQADEAERWFHQALYLDPGCHEALVHLALLAERRGDREQAAHYRRRAGRLGGTGG
jgi:chemotaxis protein methyltransferase WspC